MRNEIKAKQHHLSGLTLIELMVAVGILALVLCGLLQLFIYCLNLGLMAGDLTIANSEAQGKMEEIRNHSFDSIVTDYDGKDFDLDQLDGSMEISIDNSPLPANDELLEIEIVVSWQSKEKRIITTSLVSLIAKR